MHRACRGSGPSTAVYATLSPKRGSEIQEINKQPKTLININLCNETRTVYRPLLCVAVVKKLRTKSTKERSSSNWTPWGGTRGLLWTHAPLMAHV